jgi:hypothetical protein
MSRRLQLLRDRHRGERCVIVANGPSLNEMRLGFLRQCDVIGLNKIFLGLDRFGFYPRYYVAVNPKVVVQSIDAIRRLNCVRFIGARAAREAAVEEDALTHIVATDHPPARFSTDLALGIHEGWTVTHAALQVAYHLGYAEVALIGLDHRYQYSGPPNAENVLNGADPNHFSADYFGHGQAWDNPDLARSEESYRAAREQFERVGRRIVDATPGGSCPVFDKVDYRAYFADLGPTQSIA